MEQENLSTPSIKSAYKDFLKLEKCSGQQRDQGIKAMARRLEQAFDEILDANTLDLIEAREMAVPEIIINWLKLTPERLQTTVQIINKIAQLPDPFAKTISPSKQQLNIGQGYSVAIPLGVIAFIYEALPELGAIAAAMSLKTSNSIILRGTSESNYSNNIITRVLQSAIAEADLPANCLQFFSSDQGSFLQDLVTQSQYIQLVIPYGRPSLVQQVTQLATVPLLTSTMGNCYLYWSNSGDVDLVSSIIIDSHKSQPDPVNAIEKVLIEANYKPSTLLKLWKYLQQEGFQLRGDQELVEEFSEYLIPVQPEEWKQSYLRKIIAFKKVENLEEGISLINQASNNHANCLVTDSYEQSRRFAQGIKSAFIYLNSSPKFSRISKDGEAVFLGISNQINYRRGLITLESLTTFKQVINS